MPLLCLCLWLIQKPVDYKTPAEYGYVGSESETKTTKNTARAHHTFVCVRVLRSLLPTYSSTCGSTLGCVILCVYIPAVGVAQHGRDVNLPVGADLNILWTLCMHHAYMRRVDGCLTECWLLKVPVPFQPVNRVHTPDRDHYYYTNWLEKLYRFQYVCRYNVLIFR